MDVILFGAGEMGRRSIPDLEKNVNILFLVDNNKAIQGSVLGKYEVRNPHAIREYQCNIIITTYKYQNQIAEQLQEMGIGIERIFFYGCNLVDSQLRYEVLPFQEKRLQGTGRKLEEYDLRHVIDNGTAAKRILIFTTFYSTYTKQLIENMSKRYQDIEFDILTSDRKTTDKIDAEGLKHIYYFATMVDLKTILEQLPIYDAMQLLWIENEWVYFYRLIREKTKILNLNVGGSDFYRATSEEREYKRRLIECADRITAETEGTLREFGDYYGPDVQSKIGLLPFGIEVLNYIEKCEENDRERIKEKYELEQNRIVVTCGYNAGAAHQHEKMIEALTKVNDNIKKQIICVFPMTYPSGQETYIKTIESKLVSSGLSYKILTDFMDFSEMAEYAQISDIMIHVQVTDQLSSTMLEEMYAGSVVIAGSWLPYESLRNKGIFFLSVDAVSELSRVMEDAVANLYTYKEKCSPNRAAVWKHSSWDELAPKWRAMWG